MSMFDKVREKLEEYEVFTPKFNPITQKVVDSIVSTTVHTRLKAAVAIAQMSAFATQFKRNIVLSDNSTEVPVNAIVFIVKGSGYGGDSSVNMARKCFTEGYKLIEEERYSRAVKRAIAKAKAAQEELYTDEAVYKDYMQPIPPIDISVTTEPGLIQHINDIGRLDLSAGFLYAGETSDELAYNPDMMASIKVISECYDLGIKQAKYTKGAEHRSEAIHGEPVSALFIGSPGHILYDETTRKKFEVAFMSKLARRSYFCYVPEKIPEPEYETVEEMLRAEEEEQKKAIKAREGVTKELLEVAKFGIKTSNTPLELSKEVNDLFMIYKRYNSEYADSLPNSESVYALIRRHLQWKALKLAGTYAILDKSDVVKAHHYIDAIRMCELFDKDMLEFENDLNKTGYEKLSDYLQSTVDEQGKSHISLHDIKKKGFSATTSQNKIEELIKLASGYDPYGIYKISEQGTEVLYTKIFKTDTCTVSYKSIDTSELDKALETGDKEAVSRAKQNIARVANKGFETVEATFDRLNELLEDSFAYSPFKLRNGIRGRDNIEGGAKWVVFDIDNGVMEAEEAHFMLSHINHHIALTSNATNTYRYRVLIELDSSVELNPREWKVFYTKIAEDLGLNVDVLPQSQIFFSYKGREIYSNTDAEPLATRDYVALAKEKPKKLDNTLLDPVKLKDPLNTFRYAFEAPSGQGSLAMYRMMQHAKRLGATPDKIKELIDDVNTYWASDEGAMSEERIEKLKEQVDRLF